MLLEDLLILFAGGVSIFFIGIPGYKLVRSLFPPRRDPFREAQQRLEQARLDAEATRLNRETEQIYDHMYHEALDEKEDREEEQQRNIK